MSTYSREAEYMTTNGASWNLGDDVELWVAAGGADTPWANPAKASVRPSTRQHTTDHGRCSDLRRT